MTDIALPFVIESSGLRGRVVRMDTVLDQILTSHAYAAPVARLTAEVATLAVLLGSMLKYDGIFTLQTQGEGPVNMLVSDFTSGGDVRACAKIREKAAPGSSPLLGKGYMAFTVDQGENTERYQGIVELKDDSLLKSIQIYFTQSEQIRTGIKMSVGQVDGVWRGAAIMLQDMPEEGGLPVAGESVDVSADEEHWRHAMIMMESAADEELLTLPPEELLFRLFHEEGVRVFEGKALRKNCRCSMEKVEGILVTLSEEDIVHITVDGQVRMTCEFCSREFNFDPADVDRIMKA